jgi:excisionase family DNA binding protein
VTETTAFELAVRDRKRLAAHLAGSRPLAVRTSDGEIGLPPVAQRAVEQLLSDLACGGVVHVLADDRELTTQDVADLLGLSRTFVVRLIDTGKLPAHHAGTHRRVRAADAIAYAQQRRKRLAAVDAIADADRAGGVRYR